MCICRYEIRMAVLFLGGYFFKWPMYAKKHSNSSAILCILQKLQHRQFQSKINVSWLILQCNDKSSHFVFAIFSSASCKSVMNIKKSFLWCYKSFQRKIFTNQKLSHNRKKYFIQDLDKRFFCSKMKSEYLCYFGVILEKFPKMVNVGLLKRQISVTLL